MKKLKLKFQKWLINSAVPFDVLDSLWVIAHAVRKIYQMNKDQFGLRKTNNLINTLNKLLPKKITNQKIP